MLLEEGLYTYLATQTAITALVSTRVYPVTAPQGTLLPYIVYSKVDTRPTQAFDSAARLATSRMQFDCYATKPLQAKTMVDTLRIALDGKRGTWGSVVVGSSLWLNEVDLYEQETAIHAIAVDFDITYEL